jgi:hypothetical protein
VDVCCDAERWLAPKFRDSKQRKRGRTQNTTLGDDDVTEETVELLVVADGELEVTGDDTRLLVVTVCFRGVSRGFGRRAEREDMPCSVSSELEDLGSEVFEDSGEVD